MLRLLIWSKNTMFLQITTITILEYPTTTRKNTLNQRNISIKPLVVFNNLVKTYINFIIQWALHLMIKNKMLRQSSIMQKQLKQIQNFIVLTITQLLCIKDKKTCRRLLSGIKRRLKLTQDIVMLTIIWQISTKMTENMNRQLKITKRPLSIYLLIL